jgi:hypothetical protein
VKTGHSGLANRRVRFFQRTPISILLIESYSNILLIISTVFWASFPFYLDRSSGGGSGATEIEEEGSGGEGEEEEEIFDVEEINPPSYVDIGHLGFRVPMNPTWRARVSYKGKTKSVRENRRILARTKPRDVYDYRFHSLFQQDFYEPVIMTKSKPVANSQ